MSIKIWSSVSLKILEKTILESGIDSTKFELISASEDLNFAEVLFGTIPVEQLVPVNAIKWIQLESTGATYLKGIQVPKITNVAGVSSRVIAESLLGSLLSVYRGLFWCRESQKEKKWRRWEIRSTLTELSNQNLVILGGGTIAKNFIELIHPFRCSITVFRQNNLSIEGCLVITKVEELEQALFHADIVINTLPATPTTENFLSNQRLSIIPKNAVLVNLGRGSTMDEKALVERLTSGKLAAAILDVTRQEPIEEASPLWNIPNLYLTQHTFAGHEDETQWVCQFFVENLKRYIKGYPLLNKIQL